MPPDPPILDYARSKVDDGKPDMFTDGRTDLYLRPPAAELPRRCIICNNRSAAPQNTVRLVYADPEIRRSYRGGIMFYWIYILLLIVRNIHERAVRKFIRVTYTVCPMHRGNRGLILFLRITLLLGCIALLPISQIMDLGDGIGFLGCIAIVLNLIFPWPKRRLRIDRMTATHAVLVGASREFLQSLREARL
jgi:hypothetical protein